MKKLLSLLFVVLLMLTGCSSANDTVADDSGEESVVTWALAGNWNTLQPGHYAETGYYGPLVWQNIYDQLVMATDEGYGPRGAESWAISEDGLVITLNLAKDAKFSDGEPVTAKDWVFSAKLISDEGFGAPDYTKLNVLIAGTDENGLLAGGVNATDDTFGVKALDDYTLEITFKDPITLDTFLSSYAFLYFCLPAHCFEGMDGKAIAESDFWDNPVCSGAWTVESNIVNSEITFVPNANYHMGTAKLDKLVVVQMDTSNYASALMSGSVDYVYPAVDPKSGAALQSNPNVNVEVSEYPYTTMFLMINNEKVSKDVRIAIDMAVNKAELVEQLYGEGAIPVETIELYGTDLYYDGLSNRYDPEGAKTLLESSGWDMSENFVILTPTGTRASIATYVQQALQKIGMTVEVKTVGVGTMYGEAIAGNAHMIMGQGSATLDPLYFAYNHSYANRNSTCIHNTNDELDVIAEKITNAASDEDRKAAIAEYQQKMYDDALIVPIAQVYDYTVTSARLGGVNTSLTPHVSDNTWEWFVK